MRSRTTEWFETKISYEKTQDDGMPKKVTEAYVVDALSFTEAERRILDEMSAYITGEFAVTDIKKAPYKEVFFTDADADDRWFRAKLQFITFDEKTDKEKRTSVTYLVQAARLQQAVAHVVEVMKTTMIDYVITSVTETRIMDVYEYGASQKAATDDKPEYEE